MEIFSLVLQSAIGWGVGRILDVVARCVHCGDPTPQEIGNVQSNDIYCSNCHSSNIQFTNACDFTVNRRTMEIGQGLICPDGNKWRWNGERVYIPHFIRLVGLRGRDVMLKTVIKTYDSEELVASHSNILSPNYDSSRYEDYWHSFDGAKFKGHAEKYFSVDSYLLSEHKDLIAEDRRIIQPYE